MEKYITTSHLLPSAEEDQNNTSIFSSDIAIAEEILEVIFSQGRINRNKIRSILEKYPGNSYINLQVTILITQRLERVQLSNT